MFIICALIYFVGGIIDMVLLEAELQPWAVIDIKLTDEEKKSKEKKHLVNHDTRS